MVTVMRGGEEVKISKRAGSYVTLRDLIDETGADAVRWFLIARKPDSQLVFDIDLARSQTLDNPVYYVQLSHARIHGLMRKLAERDLTYDRDAGLAQPSCWSVSSRCNFRSVRWISTLSVNLHRRERLRAGWPSPSPSQA